MDLFTVIGKSWPYLTVAAPRSGRSARICSAGENAPGKPRSRPRCWSTILSAAACTLSVRLVSASSCGGGALGRPP